MVRLSEHTRLMNILITLSKIEKVEDENWENPLLKLGYKLDYLELNIPEVNPDAVFTSEINSHSLLFDCKKRSIKEKQAKKYDNIRKNPRPLSYLVTIHNPSMYYADPLFISYHDEICNFDFVQNMNLPLLQLIEIKDKNGGIQKGILKLRCGDLVNGHMYPQLVPLFANMELPSKILRSYLNPIYIDPYQKDEGDECKIFVYRIIKEVTSIIVKNAQAAEPPISIEAEKILKNIYGGIWELIDDKRKKDLQKFVRRCMNYFRTSSSFLKKKLKIEEPQKGTFVFIFDIDPINDIKKLTSEFGATIDGVLKKMCATSKQQVSLSRWGLGKYIDDKISIPLKIITGDKHLKSRLMGDRNELKLSEKVIIKYKGSTPDFKSLVESNTYYKDSGILYLIELPTIEHFLIKFVKDVSAGVVASIIVNWLLNSIKNTKDTSKIKKIVIGYNKEINISININISDRKELEQLKQQIEDALEEYIETSKVNQ